jgi:hypothetical protein
VTGSNIVKEIKEELDVDDITPSGSLTASHYFKGKIEECEPVKESLPL